MVSRLAHAGKKQPAPRLERESKLHEQILKECAARGWLAFHGSTAHRTHRTEGEPDFIILQPFSQFLLIECKRPGIKRSPAQLGVAAWAQKLSHKVHVVESFDEFLNLSHQGA